MKLLIVEDSRFLRLSMEKALVRAGYEVIVALDGDEALQVAGNELPDAILLDLLLPKMGGVDVLKALKKNPATSSIPVIVLTSMSQKNAGKLEKDGAAAFVEKSDLILRDAGPAGLSLLETIKTVLDGRVRKAPNRGSGADG